MITEYVTEREMRDWKPWQREYRFGVLLIFPPEPPLSEVNRLRSRWDPISQAACDAHVSLTVPLALPLDESHWSQLATVASGVDRFVVEYGPLKDYLPHPGVTIDIKPEDKIDSLRVALENTPAFENAPPRRYPYSPHMTIAEFISVQETRRLMIELKETAPRGTFMLEKVSYAVPDANLHFSERRFLVLSNH